MTFSVERLVNSILLYLDREDIDTSIEDDSLIDKDFLNHLQFAFSQRTIYSVIESIYGYFSYHLYRNSLKIENIFPTLNKKLREFNLDPIDISYEKPLFTRKEKSDERHFEVEKSVELIRLLTKMFRREYPYQINKESVLKMSEDFHSGKIHQNLVFQDFQQGETDSYNYTLLEILFECAMDDSRELEFYKHVGTFLTTVSFFQGNSISGIASIFTFFDILLKFNERKGGEFESHLLSLKKLYIDAFMAMKNIIPPSRELIEIEMQASADNLEIMKKPLIRIEEKTLLEVSNAFKINNDIWVSPITKKLEWRDITKKYDEVRLQMKDFTSGKNRKVLFHSELKSHQLKLMLITRILYNITRQCYRDNEKIVCGEQIKRMIDTVEDFISQLMENNHSSILDQRLLSMISAKNSVKMIHNEINSCWDPEDIVNKALEELRYIAGRRYFLNDPSTVGKMSEEFAKIQDYMNMKNIYITVEPEYQKHINDMFTMASIQSLMFINESRIDYKLVDTYDVVGSRYYQKDPEFINIRDTRTIYYQELGENLLASAKFLGPAVVTIEGTTSSYKTAVDMVDDYWNYFAEFRKIPIKPETWKNSNNLRHV